MKNTEWGELIRHLRLEAVHEDLRDPRLQNLTILATGMHHGMASGLCHRVQTSANVIGSTLDGAQ
ncbi:hypothetical protein cgR_6132 [Corynebacterium glutamicum R]|uniref:Uncharacterized protein n=1 Tax=Corynebacterium glutamicum (strain R) TaxID=340322 RepID=A0AB72VFM6_CORGB|nr:hypothetical protein cgR_6132 [Corynebacterium glutamicum R]